MKITARQEQLSHGLRVAGRAVGTRSPLPITANILLATDGRRLRVAATNLEIAITTWIEATVGEEGSVTLPAKLLTEFVDTLPAEPVEIGVKSGSHAARVQAGRFEATIRGMSADDFPAIPASTEETAATVQASLLKEMLEQVVFAAAMDDTRPVLTGVLATFGGDEVTLTATNGFRLATRSGRLDSQAAGDFSVIIPARTLAELSRILPDGDEDVEISVTPNRNQVVFRTEGLHVVSRLVEGQYPNYRQIIPAKFSTRVVVNTGELLKATKIASFFSRDNSNIVTLDVQPGGEAGVGSVAVMGAAAELGEDRGELDAVVNGGAQKVSFNSRYITDVLGVVRSDQVGLELTGPNSAAVFKPIDSAEYTHVVMPMHVPGA